MILTILLVATLGLSIFNALKVLNNKKSISLHSSLILFLSIDIILATTAFTLPMLFDSFDRFGLSAIRKSYGFIRQENSNVDLIVIVIYFSYSVFLNFTRIYIVSHNDIRISIPQRISNKYCIFLITICFFMMAPFFIFGEGSGYFWTTSLFYVTPFVFVLFLNIKSNRMGYFLFLLFAILFMLRGSKGDIIYVLMTVFIYKMENKKNIKNLIIISPIVIMVGMLTSLLVRDELTLIDNLFAVIILREYSIEMTGALIYYDNLRLIPSWIAFELTSLVPAFLMPLKIRPSNFALELFMPYDYESNPDSGFYRSVFFPFIHDFGLIEGVFVTLFMIFLLILFVRNKMWGSDRLKFSIALPLVVYSHWLSNGEYGIYILNTFFSAIFIYFLQFIVKNSNK